MILLFRICCLLGERAELASVTLGNILQSDINLSELNVMISIYYALL